MDAIAQKLGIEQKELEVNGKKYLVQKMPFKAYYQTVERCKDTNGNLLPSKFYEEIMKTCIISPKTTWEDFESIEEIEEVMTELGNFLVSKSESSDRATQSEE